MSLHHEDEVGQRGRIDVAARARSHDEGNLRDHPRRQDIALENLAIARERGDPLLDAGAAGVKKPNEGRPVFERHILQAGDFLSVRFGKRAAENGKILGEDEDGAAIDGAPSRHDSIARHAAFIHAELRRAMLDEHAKFLERPFIGKERDPLPRGEFSTLVLGKGPLFAAAVKGLRAARGEAFETRLHWRMCRGYGRPDKDLPPPPSRAIARPGGEGLPRPPPMPEFQNPHPHARHAKPRRP